MAGIMDLVRKRIVIGDGATGTRLQTLGLKLGEFPERWNLEKPDGVLSVHREYFAAGSDFVLSNTFGGNRHKLDGSGLSVADVVSAGVGLALQARDEAAAASGCPKFAALDIGPTGGMLAPFGDLDFEDVFEMFAETVRAGRGADFIVVETMSSTLEMKAAVLAAKTYSDLPVFATAVFDASGKMLTGADVRSAVALLEGLGADVVGMNCGLGPNCMLPLVEQMYKCASVPVMVKPNAGMPRAADGAAVYDVGEDDFAKSVSRMVSAGAGIVGGCCGTSPSHIAALAKKCAGMTPPRTLHRTPTVVSSGTMTVEIGGSGITLIGERINPTGKKRFKRALREGDVGYIVSEGVAQRDSGAQILDVNVGLPGIDEISALTAAVRELQPATGLPLQIDTSDPAALEAALRCYDGKAMINSVNGSEESLSTVLPLVKKYGGVVVGLTLDESGIPATAKGRVDIARRIIARAEEYGIDRRDIVIDTLCMSAGTDAGAARITLDALRQIRSKLDVHTILGVSNVSFGLPDRDAVNSAFLIMALEAGLSAAIMDPGSAAMRSALSSWKALSGHDPDCAAYVAAHSGMIPADAAPQIAKLEKPDVVPDLRTAIAGGLRSIAKSAAELALIHKSPMEIVDNDVIPALDETGRGFEAGKIFLPQLLMSAEAAREAFSVIKERMEKDGGGMRHDRGKVVLATVKGDIHDIGKNIVRSLLENYGFDVIDMGRDVPPEKVVGEVLESGARLVGLSALMTTTVASMAETVRQLRAAVPECRIMVGGAVLTKEYADSIGADHYSPDAMDSVRYASEIYGARS